MAIRASTSSSAIETSATGHAAAPMWFVALKLATACGALADREGRSPSARTGRREQSSGEEADELASERLVGRIDQRTVAWVLPLRTPAVHQIRERKPCLGVGETDRAAGTEVAEATGICTHRPLGLGELEAEAEARRALERPDSVRPDVVLMDSRMPRMNGAEASNPVRIHKLLPDTQVLVLTIYADDESLFPAPKAGARGYLTKDVSAEEIEQAILSLHACRSYLDPVVQERLLTTALDTHSVTRSNTGELPDDLTPREAGGVKADRGGLPHAEIVQTLVSGATVKTHINRTFNKTGVRAALRRYADAFEHRIA